MTDMGEIMKVKRKTVKELSLELNKTTYEPIKINKFKLLILSLFGIKLKTCKFRVGDILKRKTSDNPKEMYEVKMCLFDENLDRVIVATDFTKNQLVTIHELDFGSFILFNDVMPGTITNPKDI
jgi:hypothetical protein